MGKSRAREAEEGERSVPGFVPDFVVQLRSRLPDYVVELRSR